MPRVRPLKEKVQAFSAGPPLPWGQALGAPLAFHVPPSPLHPGLQRRSWEELGIFSQEPCWRKRGPGGPPSLHYERIQRQHPGLGGGGRAHSVCRPERYLAGTTATCVGDLREIWFGNPLGSPAGGMSPLPDPVNSTKPGSAHTFLSFSLGPQRAQA